MEIMHDNNKNSNNNNNLLRSFHTVYNKNTNKVYKMEGAQATWK